MPKKKGKPNRLPRTLNCFRRALSSSNGMWENKSNMPIPTDNAHKCLLEQLSSLPTNTIMNRMTGDKVSFPEMADRSLRVAAKLRSCGVREGDHVMLFSPNHENYVSSVVGLMSIGAVPCLANPSYTEYELGALCKSSDIKFLVSGAVNMPIARKISESQNIPILYVVDEQEGWTAGTDPINDLFTTGLDDLALIAYSSGTTGLPKGVMLSHHNLNIERKLVNTVGAFGVTEGLPNPVDSTWQYKQCSTRHKYTWSYIRRGIEENSIIVKDYTGKPDRCLLPSRYGMTETSAAITMQEKTCTKTGSVGTLLEHCQMKVRFQEPTYTSKRPIRTRYLGHVTGTGYQPIRDQYFLIRSVLVVEPGTETILPDGQAGEILLGGPLIMKGYYKNEKATAETLTSDNFVRTGDVGYIDTEGTLFITDRLKELIKVKGFQVAPAELEGVLASHPAIGDAAVIGIPHEKFGEVPKAFITPAPGDFSTCVYMCVSTVYNPKIARERGSEQANLFSVTITVDEVKEIISSRLSAEKQLGEVRILPYFMTVTSRCEGIQRKNIGLARACARTQREYRERFITLLHYLLEFYY
eukprot:sb/3463342/